MTSDKQEGTRTRALGTLEGSTGVILGSDPAHQKVTVYRSLEDIQILSADQELDGGDVLPGFRANVNEIFTL